MRVLCLHGISKDAWNRYSEKGSWYYEVIEPWFQVQPQRRPVRHRHPPARQRSSAFTRCVARYVGVYNRRLIGCRRSGAAAGVRLRPPCLASVCAASEPRRADDRPRRVHQRTARSAASGPASTSFRFRCTRSSRNGPAQKHNQCPKALALYQRLISLPLYPSLTMEQINYVADSVQEIARANARAPSGRRRRSRSRPVDADHPSSCVQHSRLLIPVVFAVLAAASVCRRVSAAFRILRFPPPRRAHLWNGIWPCRGRASCWCSALPGATAAAGATPASDDVYKLLLANIVGSVIWCALAVVLIGPGFPRSVYGIDLVLSFLATGGARLLVRSYFEAADAGGAAPRSQQRPDLWRGRRRIHAAERDPFQLVASATTCSGFSTTTAQARRETARRARCWGRAAARR